MKTSILASALSFLAAASAVSVSYDTGYDDAARSMNVVSCSDGPNGLAGQYPTQGALPTFPNIGGVPAIAGHGSPECGSCWQLTYEGNSIYVLGIDHSTDYNIALAAMNDLTNGNAEFLGRVEATATEVDPSLCGL
ncbi:hypothetical protein VUR80DRAFT_5314 [Thermomyces stellatus]